MNTNLKWPKAKSAAPTAGAPRPPQPESLDLSLDTEPQRAAAEARSTDPYNTSGSFDRTKNWAKVGKR